MILTLKRYAEIAWQELRPMTYLLLGLHVCIAFAFGWYVTGGADFLSMSSLARSGLDLLIGLLLVALWYINATTTNDLADEEIDHVNLKGSAERPLVNGAATTSQLQVVVGVSAVVLLLVSLRGGIWLCAVTALLLGLNRVYSFPPLRISYRGVLAPLMLPLGYVGYPLAVGFILTGSQGTWQWALLLVGLYALFVSRVMLKDFRDVAGDKKYGKRTFLLRHSASFVTHVSQSVHVFGTACVAILAAVFLKDAVAAIHVVLIGVIVQTYFVALSHSRGWSKQKLVLPILGRMISLQSIVLFASTVFWSRPADTVWYWALLGLLDLGIWRIIVMHRRAL